MLRAHCRVKDAKVGWGTAVYSSKSRGCTGYGGKALTVRGEECNRSAAAKGVAEHRHQGAKQQMQVIKRRRQSRAPG